MSIKVDALTWQGIVIDGDPDGESPIYLDDGIEGLSGANSSVNSTPRSTGGNWGGVSTVDALTITASAWLDADHAGERDWSPLWDLRKSMGNRALPTDEQPLAWSALTFPDGEWCAFVRPQRREWLTNEDAVHGGSPGLDLQWGGSEGVIYSLNETDSGLWDTEDPVSEDEFEIANSGMLVPGARRAFRLRITAHGTVVGPWVRVDHADSTFEKISFPGLTMTGGQVLTVGDDLIPRVGSQIVSGYTRSLTERGIQSRAPRWWLLHESDGADEANVCTVGATSGVFSGFLKTRSTVQ